MANKSGLCERKEEFTSRCPTRHHERQVDGWFAQGGKKSVFWYKRDDDDQDDLATVKFWHSHVPTKSRVHDDDGVVGTEGPKDFLSLLTGARQAKRRWINRRSSTIHPRRG